MNKKTNLSYFSPSIVRRRDKNKRFYYVDKSSGKKRDKISWEKSLEYRKDKNKFSLSDSEKEFLTVIQSKESEFNDYEDSGNENLSVFVYELKRLSNIFLFSMKRGKILFDGVSYTKKNSFEFLNKMKRQITSLYKMAKDGTGSSLVKAEIIVTKTTLKIIDIYN